jgi:signal transduction histidine kinase
MTYHAPPERATADRLERQRAALQWQPLVRAALDRVPDAVLVLNAQRQIVLANQPAAALLERDPDALLGLRPGEAIECIHANDGPYGCGTSLFCTVCGAVRAVLQSQQSAGTVVSDCRITRQRSGGREALELRVWSSTLRVDGVDFTLLALRDVAAESRLRTFERVLLGDVRNALGGLQGLLELIPGSDVADAASYLQIAGQLTRQVLEEIEAHLDLAAAEAGTLEVHEDPIDVAALLESVRAGCLRQVEALGKAITPPQLVGETRIVSDERLLRRTLAGLVNNALEASRPGQKVTLSFSNQSAPTFRIHNEDVMPESVQLQVFQRSFSTHSADRGLGAYSVKLIVERYLGGHVGFFSRPGFGTAFTLTLPQATLVPVACASVATV